MIVYFISRRRGKSKIESVGLSSDMTTMILFFSVPLSIFSIWGKNYHVLVFIIAIIVAIIFTFLDWRTKKEIHIPPLFKKIWRTYFVLLMMAYLLIWMIGIVRSVWINTML